MKIKSESAVVTINVTMEAEEAEAIIKFINDHPIFDNYHRFTDEYRVIQRFATGLDNATKGFC